MVEACERIKDFCEEHHKTNLATNAKKSKIQVENMEEESHFTNGLNGSTHLQNGHTKIKQNGVHRHESDKINNKVTSMEAAMLKECAIRNVDQFVEEIECD